MRRGVNKEKLKAQTVGTLERIEKQDESSEEEGKVNGEGRKEGVERES